MTDTVLITGCSSGFGRAAVTAFRTAGWNVVATMRDPAQWAGNEDAGLFILPLDVTNKDSIEAAFSSGAKRFGHVSAVVNNAGRGLLSVFETTPCDTIEQVFATNVFGPMAIMRAAVPYLRQAGGGRVVNVTSGSAIVPEPLMSIYSASKAALDNFSEAVSFELSPQGITLKLVVPGFVAGTNFIGQTQAAAQAVPVPTEYQSYVDQRLASYAAADPAAFATEDDVANTIVAATTDNTGRLRWLVGRDVAEYAHFRWETSEAEYSAWAHARLSSLPEG